MFKPVFGSVWLLGLTLLLGSCSVPPKPDCVPGFYALNLDSRVQLLLSTGTYRLIAGSDQAGGTYNYDHTKSEIAFEPGPGVIGEAARREIHERTGINRNLDAVLDALAGGRQPEVEDISEDQNGAIDIEADPGGINFVKPSCRGSATTNPR